MKVFRSARFLLLAFLLCLVPASSFAGVFVSINIAPPVLPVYVQPPCPTEGYMWTPGYWAYGDAGYYWVPGAWVPAPEPGFLWTPPYWGWEGGNYLFHAGYWGSHIGYYGGVNYGFGYMGVGFAGGEWRGGHFFYNTAIVHVGGGFHNTFVNETIVHNTTIINNNHVAYSGGPGGIRHDPTPAERSAMNEHHIAPTSVQQQHIAAAAHNPQQRFSANHGRPATVAAARPMTSAAHNQPVNHAATVNHGAGAARPEAHSAPAAHNETRPAAQSHSEARPESHATSAPHTQSRPASQPHSAPKPSGGKPHGR